MLKRFSFSSEFSKNVVTLMTGTAIAQAIPLAISPILTRIYTPEDFGIFAFYISIASVISVISTGRYEFAITLPKKDKDALQILSLTILIVTITAVLALLIIVLFHDRIVTMLGNKKIGGWLYFIPLTVFLSGVYKAFNYWFNRKRKYASLSKSRILQSSSTNATNLGLGAVYKMSPIGLIVGNIFGQFTSVIYFIFLFILDPIKSKITYNKKSMLAWAKRYRDFPKYDMLGALFNISSNQITHVFFNTFFTAVISGNYFLVQRLFSAPINLLAGAVQDVFKMEIISLHLENGNTRKLFLKTLKRLFILSLIPSLSIFFLAEHVFSFIFGEAWGVAGTYVKIMTPVFFLRFLSFPLSYMFYVVEKQIYNTVGQFILVTSIIAVFLLGKNYGALIVVELLSVVYSLFYLIYIYISFSLTSKGELK